MTLEIIVPQLSKAGKTKKIAKDLVISTLAKKFPLTLTKLTNSIKKDFRVSVTFQGVRKAVNLLVEENIVKKTKKEYQLNKDWILSLRDFSEKLQNAYFNKTPEILDVESIGEEIKVYTFDNLISLDKFWNGIISKWFSEDARNKKKKFYVQQSGHTWYVLGQLEEETNIVEQIKKHNINFYTFSAGNTYLDNWCKKYYLDQNFFYKTSKESKETSDYFAVYNDFIIQTTYPKKLSQEINNIYNQTKDFQSFNIARLIKILRKKTKLKVTIMKNPVVAKQLRNSILSKFNI